LGIQATQATHSLQKRFARPLYQINYFANKRDEGCAGVLGLLGASPGGQVVRKVVVHLHLPHFYGHNTKSDCENDEEDIGKRVKGSSGIMKLQTGFTTAAAGT